jgi:superfamily II DNA or RNA helicase
MNKRDVLDKADFILCDELHRYSSDVTSEIIKETVNAKYKWGLTGTLPDDEGASSRQVRRNRYGNRRPAPHQREHVDAAIQCRR